MLPKANPAVTYRRLPDGAALFSPAEEAYYGLNLTGACIWENLAPVCRTVDELCTEVGRCFPDAEPERLRRDVSGLLANLVECGLVTPE